MQEKTEKQLLGLIKKLDEATVRVRTSQGYDEETAYIHLLTEMVREQVPNANSQKDSGSAVSAVG